MSKRRFTIGHDCRRWEEFKVNINDIVRLETFDFKRCPYCGDKLDKNMKSYVEVELDTLHYGDKRLHDFVNRVLKKNYKITDQFESGQSYLLVIETEEDGDKIAHTLTRGFWEVKSAHDRRHDRYTLN